MVKLQIVSLYCSIENMKDIKKIRYSILVLSISYEKLNSEKETSLRRYTAKYFSDILEVIFTRICQKEKQILSIHSVIYEGKISIRYKVFDKFI